jgi:hypothetical protein
MMRIKFRFVGWGDQGSVAQQIEGMLMIDLTAIGSFN